MEELIEFKKKIQSDIIKVFSGHEVLYDFLDENEASILEDLCNKNNVTYYKYGGFINSDRNRYILSNYDVDNSNFKISVFKINYNKRYYNIEHKHVLGTLMSLGIKRKTIGDIIIDDKKDIYFSSTNEIAKFLVNELQFINHAKIELEPIDYEIENIIKYEEKEIFTSSYRLDGIISGVYNISRSKSQEMIISGLVYVNHIENMNVNHNVKENDVINVRHYGKFTISELIGNTRSGRLRIKVLIRR